VVEAALKLFEETLDALVKAQRACDPAFGIFVLFDVWEKLSASVPELEEALRVRALMCIITACTVTISVYNMST
jgi:hypothetical protein